MNTIHRRRKQPRRWVAILATTITLVAACVARADAQNFDAPDVQVVRSVPTSNGWSVSAISNSGSSTLTADVICAFVAQ